MGTNTGTPRNLESLAVGFSEEDHSVLEEMDREEETFAARLRIAMENIEITQEQLAVKIGVGQPAISNMLNRQCRPQHRTVIRLADALGVTAGDLWPGFPNEPNRG